MGIVFILENLIDNSLNTVQEKYRSFFVLDKIHYYEALN